MAPHHYHRHEKKLITYACTHVSNKSLLLHRVAAMTLCIHVSYDTTITMATITNVIPCKVLTVSSAYDYDTLSTTIAMATTELYALPLISAYGCDTYVSHHYHHHGNKLITSGNVVVEMCIKRQAVVPNKHQSPLQLLHTPVPTISELGEVSSTRQKIYGGTTGKSTVSSVW